MKAKILIVDDEEALRFLAKTVLQGQGYEVSEAADAQSLRRLFPSPAPHLVILDLNLPDGNGIKLLPEVKQHWPMAKVLILTGYGTVDAAEEAYKVADVYLQSKPLDPDILKALVAMARAEKPPPRN